MNKRIRELIAQAREPLHNKNLPFNQGLMEYSEKFAELIVKECIIRAEREWIRNGSETEHNQAVSKVIDSIKRHFGVEE